MQNQFKSRATVYLKLSNKTKGLRKMMTSGARETGKATVSDSARAGESQKTDNNTAADTPNPNTLFAVDSISTCRPLQKALSFSSNEPRFHAHETETFRFWFTRGFENENTLE